MKIFLALLLFAQDPAAGHYAVDGEGAAPFAKALEAFHTQWEKSLGGSWGEAVLEVHVFDDLQEYESAGAPERTVSWYNPARKEILVSFDARNLVSGRDNTTRWLCLEGTRQYLHAAHTAAYENPQFPGWLEEGLAEYFSSAIEAGGAHKIASLKTVYADANLKAVQRHIKERKLAKIPDVMKMDRDTFYKRRPVHSLTAWAIVYYLMNAPDPGGGRGKLAGAIPALLKAFAEGKGRSEAYAAALVGEKGPLSSATIGTQVKSYFRRIKSNIKPRDDGSFIITETEHYTIQVENTAPDVARLVKESEQMMELIFTRYQAAFGGEGKLPQKAIARLYGTQAGYRRSGAPPGSAAYYNPTTKELVGYRSPLSFNILCHEGCHQFFDMSFPGFYMQQDLPMWFSEGLADCFGASEIRGKEMYIFTLKGVGAYRIPGLKRAVNRNRHTPIPELLEMGRREFMNPRVVSIHYAQSWSFCHFLWNYPSRDKGNGIYKEVVINLIDGFKKGLPKDKVYDKAFRIKGKRLDIDKLYKQWLAYVKKLPG